MPEPLIALVDSLGLGPRDLAVAGLAAGVLVVAWGLLRADPDAPALRRMRAAARAERPDVLRAAAPAPGRLAATFQPSEAAERSQARLRLLQAGFAGSGAVTTYYLVRTLLGAGLPGLFLLYAAGPWTQELAVAPPPLRLSALQMFQGVAILAAIGFYAPALWLRGRIAARRRAIEEAFPTALDLMQISIEAGLGFDAAMRRVAAELADTAPDLSRELGETQRQIQAGRERARALWDFARRTGVEEVHAFANLILQSIELGSSVSGALKTYAEEMRDRREMKAQEKANKLPVQMSAVLASLMLPALLLITLSPVVIRYLRYFDR